MGIVDVRDIAKAHILAGFSTSASGRHIGVADHKDFLDFANVIRVNHPQYPLPKSYVPKWLLVIIAPLVGFTRKYVKLNIGIDVKFDNSYIRKDLAMEFIPFETTILDHFTQLLNDKIIKKR
jgi:hypothetical protein